MFVRKRDGRREPVHPDKIRARISHLCFGLDRSHVKADRVAAKVLDGLYQGVETSLLDELAAETAAAMTTKHPDYTKLAARIEASNLHKQSLKRFSDVVSRLFNDPGSGDRPPSRISRDFYDTVMTHAEDLDSAIVHSRDFDYSYFGLKTLQRSYLLRVGGRIVERPQHMIMRVAVAIHGNKISDVLETYQLMSQKHFTHATPTLLNAGSVHAQLASCFLIDIKGDSMEGIFETLKDCAVISKHAGGIGLNVHNIRAAGSKINSTNGLSTGLVPMLRVFNNAARFADQGGSRRPGAIAVYLEPWHADIFSFLDLRKTHGKEELRARDLFQALWIPDLFMRRVESNADWTLMCPSECPGLSEVHGEAFNTLYESYERQKKGRRTIKAQKLWQAILEAQVETGNPFMLYKDTANAKSNQKNLGTIRSSNLCTEIIQYTSSEEIAVCNLASLTLPLYIRDNAFDFQKLHEVVQVATRNLNKIIDKSFYPVTEAARSNGRHRPIGIGVSGLADIFLALRLPFDSVEARHLNIQIFETIYHGALLASCKLAEESGPYETYPDSPASKGILQFDMWGEGTNPTDLWDWASLRVDIATHGLRNSLLVAPMPTASTAQIMGVNESTEPYTSNLYTRSTLAGDFQVVNPWLLRDLVQRGLWSSVMMNQIVAERGSVQRIRNIPDDLKMLYRTVWEIPQRSILEMAADRGPFIDQSQSMNIHMREPTMGKISSMHFKAWRLGLKTGMYYLRTTAAANPIQFTVDPDMLEGIGSDTNWASATPSNRTRRPVHPQEGPPTPPAMLPPDSDGSSSGSAEVSSASDTDDCEACSNGIQGFAIKGVVLDENDLLKHPAVERSGIRSEESLLLPLACNMVGSGSCHSCSC